MENGYVKIYRSLLEWEWYQDENTARVFLHLLLTVNYEPKKWKGIEIQRGQRIASYQTLADELRLSYRNIRTAIKHLISTGEVTHKATSECGLFTVNNYDKFQAPTHNPTGGCQSSDRQATGDRQQWNKDKKDKKDNNYYSLRACAREDEEEYDSKFDLIAARASTFVDGLEGKH